MRVVVEVFLHVDDVVRADSLADRPGRCHAIGSGTGQELGQAGDVVGQRIERALGGCRLGRGGERRRKTERGDKRDGAGQKFAHDRTSMFGGTRKVGWRLAALAAWVDACAAVTLGPLPTSWKGAVSSVLIAACAVAAEPSTFQARDVAVENRFRWTKGRGEAADSPLP
jgi:hypothetical protein